MAATPSARIGMVNFINTAPLYDVWQRTVNRPDWVVTEAAPARLNHLMREGELDAAFVSSHEYAVRPAVYRILPGLSISATGPVGSVFLFADAGVEALDGRLIYLSAKSQTSAALVKIILEEFYGVHPRYRTGEITELPPEGEAVAGIMAIGDEALQLTQSGSQKIRMDLGEEWYRKTGLPFVFAVWAVRDAFCRAWSERVAEIHSELLRCAKRGRQELQSICARVAPRIPMAPEACLLYLEGIQYGLGAEKRRALELFYRYLIERGEGHPDALPVRYFEDKAGG